jgi:hypothetical protein
LRDRADHAWGASRRLEVRTSFASSITEATGEDEIVLV